VHLRHICLDRHGEGHGPANESPTEQEVNHEHRADIGDLPRGRHDRRYEVDPNTNEDKDNGDPGTSSRSVSKHERNIAQDVRRIDERNERGIRPPLVHVNCQRSATVEVHVRDRGELMLSGAQDPFGSDRRAALPEALFIGASTVTDVRVA